jgi:hypothetical protein
VLHRIVQRRAVVVPIVAGVALASCVEGIVGVPSVAAVELEIDPPVVRVGDVAAVRAVPYAVDGDPIAHRRRLPVLTSRDTLVARVEGLGTGTVRGVSPGAAVIVAESGGRRDSVVVLVTR